MQKTITSRLGLELGTITLSRAVITTFYRMMYPFLPIITRGLGVSLGAVAVVLAARSVLALASPWFGMLSDRWGRKRVLILGQGLFVLGTISIFILPTYPVFFVGVLLASAGKLVFDSSSQAYAGDRVPYSHRGLAIAIVEGSWSGAFLVGVPVVGWLIAQGGWVQPFSWLAVSGLLMGIFIVRIIPSTGGTVSGDIDALKLRDVLRKNSALAPMGTLFLMTTGVQQLYISYGALLEDRFLVQVAALGAVSAAFGMAELGGQGLVSLVTDRLGKWRAMMIGLIATAISSLVVPLFMGGLTGAVITLFIVFLCFEFTLVSGMALMSELAPEARGSMMASSLVATEGGNGIGALLGTMLLDVGILGVSMGSAALLGLGAMVLFRGVRRD